MKAIALGVVLVGAGHVLDSLGYGRVGAPAIVVGVLIAATVAWRLLNRPASF